MSRKVISATWDDVPHLTEQVKKDLYDSVVRLHPHQADARTKGVPSLGSGVIYPFPEESFVIDPVPLQPHWKYCFGLDADAGSGWTAIVWLAWDVDANIVYQFDEYKSGMREIAVHIDAIRTRGAWMPGVGDAKNLIVTEYDSKQVIEVYNDALRAAKMGGHIEYPDKAVEAGIYNVYELFVPQRLKIFRSCTKTLAERRLYRRNEKGHIVKKDDHLMDALRYAIRSGLKLAKVKPPDEPVQKQTYVMDMGSAGTGWMS